MPAGEAAVALATPFASGAWLAGVVGWPLLGSVVVLVLGRTRAGSRRAAGWAAVAAVALALACAVASLAGYLGAADGTGDARPALAWKVGTFWSGGEVHLAGAPPDAIDLGLLGDGLSLWFALVVTGVGLLIHVYSIGYMAEDPGYVRYFAELNYFIFAMSLLVLSDGLLGMLIGWANVGLASYLLIGFWHERADARAAAVKAFLVTLGGEIAIVLATAWLWDQTGSVRFYDVFARLGGVPQEALTAIGLLLLWGAAAKSAQLPLHVWLPNAMAGPTPVSALIHAATMVTAGVYLTARMYPVYAAAPVASAAVAWVGGLSALFGAVVACGQTDIKRVLAYSTMSQIGYMVMGVGLQAQMAGVFHFFTQAMFKALLFLSAGLVIHYLAGEQDMRRMGGLGGRLRLAYVAYSVGVLAMVGVPPFSGYFSKEAIVEAAWEHGAHALWAIGVLGAGVTAFYAFRMLALVFMGRPATPASAAHGGGHREDRASALAMAVPVAVLTILAAAGGIVWVPGRFEWAPRVLGPYFEQFGDGAGMPGMEATGTPGWAAWLPLVLAAAGAVAALALYGPHRQRRAARWVASRGVAEAWLAGLYIDQTYAAVIVRPAQALSRWLDRTAEGEGIDGSVLGVAALAGVASRALARLQQGFVRRYALMMLAGAAALVVWAVSGR